MFVAANTTENDVVFLPSLESIDAGNFDFLIQIFLQRPIELHVGHDVRPLTFIGSDDANLSRDNTGFEELGNYFLDI